MEPLFSQAQGLYLIAGYFAFVFLLTWVTTRSQRFTKEQFFVADRKVSMWQGAFSIAATWIWAPALFLAAQKAYLEGFPGLFWFTVPNVLCLIIFAYFAQAARQKLPKGYTLPGYMFARYGSDRVRTIYMVELIGLAVCAFAVQLLAGGQLISGLTGLSFFWVTILMAGVAFSYSVFSGIRASVVTDYAQMAIIFLAGFILVPWAITNSGGMANVWAGFAGVSGEYSSLFRGPGASVFYSFGIATTIGLLAGPFGDQSFWQRSFAIKQDVVKRAFIWGGLLFGIVPLTMSLLGFAAAGLQMPVNNPGMVNLEFVRSYLPAWGVVLFVYMVMCGLVSTLDSKFCAVSSLVGHDLREMRGSRGNDRIVLRDARLSMPVLAAVALVIANIPGMQILYLFMFYGVLRATTLLPTALSLWGLPLSERAVFLGGVGGHADRLAGVCIR